MTAAMLLASPPAWGQIYAWRDASGNLVLSDRAKDPSAQSYHVTPAVQGTGIKTTRPLSRRAVEYDALIRTQAERYGVDADLVRAVIQAESAFNPRARSVKGAMGLMQLMPATAAEFGVSDAYDPAENVRAGVAYLSQLLLQYDGREELALAAYNAGPGAVRKYGGAIPPYRETRDYVAKVRRTAGSVAAAPPGPARQVFRTVEIVDGREVVRYTGRAQAGSERVAIAERR